MEKFYLTIVHVETHQSENAIHSNGTSNQGENTGTKVGLLEAFNTIIMV